MEISTEGSKACVKITVGVMKALVSGAQLGSVGGSIQACKFSRGSSFAKAQSHLTCGLVYLGSCWGAIRGPTGRLIALRVMTPILFLQDMTDLSSWFTCIPAGSWC